MGVPKLRFKADDGSDFPDWEDNEYLRPFAVWCG